MSRTAMSLVPLALLAAPPSACTPGAPAVPTWQADVKPILAAACVRCHGDPAIGGAPTSFRLDVDHDTPGPSGRIRGAATMSRFIADRVSDDTMPPRFPLDDWQKQVLINWEGLRPVDDLSGRPFGPPPRGAPRPDNAAPTATATIAATAGDRATIDYQVSDPDRELVYGEIQIGPSPFLDLANSSLGRGQLHAGRGTVVVDLADLAPGDQRVWAVIDDGGGSVAVPLGTVAAPAAGAASPRALFLVPFEETIVADRDAALDVQVLLRDRDDLTGATATLTVVDLVDPGATPVTLATTVTGDRATATWDTFDGQAMQPLVAAGRYAIDAVVTDADGHTVTVRSPPVRVAHGATSESYDATIKAIFDGSCVLCHQGASSYLHVPGVEFDLFSYQFAGTALGAYEMRARIYRRVIVEGNMPPTSTEIDDADRALTADQRARLASWILGGAPP